MLVKAVQNFKPLSFKANENKKSASSNPTVKQDNKKLLCALAGLATITASAITIATLVKKGKAGQKVANTIQEGVQNVVQKGAEKAKKGLVKLSDGSYQNYDKNGILRFEKMGNTQKCYSKEGQLIKVTENGKVTFKAPEFSQKSDEIVPKKAPSVQRFQDGSSKVYDKNGVLRIEKNGTAKKYYTADSKLLAETTKEGESVLYDPKTGRTLMETNGDVINKSCPSEEVYLKAYDENGNMILNMQEKNQGDSWLAEAATLDGSKKVKIDDDGILAEITNADGTIKKLSEEEIAKIEKSEAGEALTSYISRKYPVNVPVAKTLPSALKHIHNYLSEGILGMLKLYD